MLNITMRSLILFIIFLLVLVTNGFIFAQEFKIPRISIDELKALMDNEDDIVILDTQPKKIYQLRHIKGAISFPWVMKIDRSAVDKLPRNRLIVLYCDCGPEEGDSNYMALQLKGLGFTQIKVLADPSIGGWVKKGYPIETEAPKLE